MLAFHFNCVPRKVKEMGFHFGNLSSRYGANNLYFTKDGRPFLPLQASFTSAACRGRCGSGSCSR